MRTFQILIKNYSQLHPTRTCVRLLKEFSGLMYPHSWLLLRSPYIFLDNQQKQTTFKTEDWNDYYIE